MIKFSQLRPMKLYNNALISNRKQKILISVNEIIFSVFKLDKITFFGVRITAMLTSFE